MLVGGQPNPRVTMVSGGQPYPPVGGHVFVGGQPSPWVTIVIGGQCTYVHVKPKVGHCGPYCPVGTVIAPASPPPRGGHPTCVHTVS